MLHLNLHHHSVFNSVIDSFFLFSINYIHAIIWCITPEEALIRPLEEEAKAINFLLQNCEERNLLGANIILLVKEPRDLELDDQSRDVQVRLSSAL